MSGQRFRWSPPYGNTPALTQALERGLPFPVYCGWGGLVKVAAQPFAEGLRFRTHLDGECTARWGGWGLAAAQLTGWLIGVRARGQY